MPVMDLKPLSPAALDTLDLQAKLTKAKPIVGITRPQVRKLSDPLSHCVKIMLFGPWASGKTYAILGLLLHGFKVLVLGSEDGLVTISNELRKLERTDLLDCVYFIVLSEYRQIVEFIDHPKLYFPEVYDAGIGWVVWDGFSGYQQVGLSDYVAEMQPKIPAEGKDGKENVLADAIDSGLFFEQRGWGMIRNGTVRPLRNFLNMYNEKTGEVWHKIVTCQEGYKNVKTGRGDSSVMVTSKTPLLQGAARELSGGEFDLIIHTRVRAENENDDRSARIYEYGIAPTVNLMSKNRGFDVGAVEPGDMFALWKKIAKPLGLQYKEEPL